MRLRLHPAHAYYLACDIMNTGLMSLSIDGIAITRENEPELLSYVAAILHEISRGTASLFQHFQFTGSDDDLVWLRLKANEKSTAYDFQDQP